MLAPISSQPILLKPKASLLPAAAGGAVSCSSVYSILYPVLYLEPNDVHREALLGI